MKLTNELFEFIQKSPSPYHAINEIKSALTACGYVELSEAETWNLTEGGKYFVIRGGSSLVSFRYKKRAGGFMICASHSDSPAFKLKMTPESVGAYTRLQVEKYGGMIYYSWFDRPLSLAGRVVLKTDDGIEAKLVNIDRDLAVIPSVAIHMNRTVNDGCKFNPALDLLPLVGSADSSGSIMRAVSEVAGVAEDAIISHDLFLYNREAGKRIGVNGEYFLSPRIDNLECVFASLKAYMKEEQSSAIPVLAVFDNEEVGSETKQGAASGFLYDTLFRIGGAELQPMLKNSFMVSCDNAHAKHPNHPELADADNAPIMNGGIVIKWNAGQKYTTDAISSAVFETLCKRCGAKTQTFYTRADMLSGSTLGSISNTKVSISTVDVGLPQLAMHSASETAGTVDLSEMIKALTEFYNTAITVSGEKIKF